MKTIVRERSIFCMDSALAFARWININCANDTPIPDSVFEQYVEDFKALEEYKDHPSVAVAICHTDRVKYRNERRKKRQASKRKSFGKNYYKVFVEIGRRDGFGCANCGNPSPDMQIDHIMPVARGGGNDLANLQLLCWKCNMSKGDRMP